MDLIPDSSAWGCPPHWPGLRGVWRSFGLGGKIATLGQVDEQAHESPAAQQSESVCTTLLTPLPFDAWIGEGDLSMPAACAHHTPGRQARLAVSPL